MAVMHHPANPTSSPRLTTRAPTSLRLLCTRSLRSSSLTATSSRPFPLPVTGAAPTPCTPACRTASTPGTHRHEEPAADTAGACVTFPALPQQNVERLQVPVDHARLAGVANVHCLRQGGDQPGGFIRRESAADFFHDLGQVVLEPL